MAETWRTSVDQLGEPGRALLERLAFLAPETLPVALIENAAALDDLVAFSLATRDPERGTFQVHRLIQDATSRDLIQAGRDKTRLTEALGWIAAAFVGNAQDVRRWAVLDPLAPHAEAVAGHADTAGIVEPTVDVMSRLATLLRAKALHGRAEPFYRRAVAIAETAFPSHDPRIATRLNNLAQLLQATNWLAEAEPLMRRALAIFCALEHAIGRTHPSRVTVQQNYEILLGEMGKTATEIATEVETVRRAAGLD